MYVALHVHSISADVAFREKIVITLLMYVKRLGLSVWIHCNTNDTFQLLFVFRNALHNILLSNNCQIQSCEFSNFLP